MKKIGLFLVCLLFCLGAIATPVSCQYVQRDGPTWLRAIDGNSDSRLVRESTAGMEASFGIAGVLLTAGAVGAFYKLVEED